MGRADLDDRGMLDDEEWAARLSSRLDVLVPAVPADISAVVRRGRRRRSARRGAAAAGAMVAVAVMIAVPAAVRQAADRSSGLDVAAPEVIGFARAVEVVDGDEQERARAEEDLVLEQVRVLHALEAALAEAEAEAAQAAAEAAAAEAEAEQARADAAQAEAEAERAEAIALDAALQAQEAALRAEEESIVRRGLLDRAQARLDQAQAQLREAQAQLSEVRAQLDRAQAQLEEARWVVDAYRLQEVPEVTPVEAVPAAQWADRLTLCLRDRGDWDVATIPGGWQATYDPTEEGAFGADLHACAVMYPVDPG